MTAVAAVTAAVTAALQTSAHDIPPLSSCAHNLPPLPELPLCSGLTCCVHEVESIVKCVAELFMGLGFSVLLAPGHGAQATYCNTQHSQQMHAEVMSEATCNQACCKTDARSRYLLPKNTVSNSHVQLYRQLVPMVKPGSS